MKTLTLKQALVEINNLSNKVDLLTTLLEEHINTTNNSKLRTNASITDLEITVQELQEINRRNKRTM